MIRAWEKLLEASGYKNVHPSVKYVNDSACAQCHEEIATAYARHPMGRSLAPTPNAESIEEFTAAANHPLKLERLLYEVRRDDGRQFHSEKRITPAAMRRWRSSSRRLTRWGRAAPAAAT